MTDREGLIASSAVRHPLERQLRHGQVTAAQPVDHDFALGTDGSDGLDRATHQPSVTLSGQAILSDGRWFVEQIERQVLARDLRVPPREDFPGMHEAVLRHLVQPQVVTLEVVAVDAIPRRTVQVETHVNPPRIARLEVRVQMLKDALVGIQVIEVRRPSAVIRGDAHEIESERCQEIQGSLVRRWGAMPVVNEHPQKVEPVTPHAASLFVISSTQQSTFFGRAPRTNPRAGPFQPFFVFNNSIPSSML
jgi:hypothetical protein